MTLRALIESKVKHTAFCEEQADACARDAAETKLANVRVQRLEAEVAWRGLASLSSARETSLREDVAKVAAQDFLKRQLFEKRLLEALG